MIYQLSDENEIQYDETGDPIYRCTYPLVQDIEEVNAWELHAGKKDDFYIYGTDGMLARFLPSGTEEFSTRLSTEEGYNNLKGAVIEVLEGIVAPVESEEPTEEETTETEEEVLATSRAIPRYLGRKIEISSSPRDVGKTIIFSKIRTVPPPVSNCAAIGSITFFTTNDCPSVVSAPSKLGRKRRGQIHRPQP